MNTLREMFWSGAKGIIQGETPDHMFFHALADVSERDVLCLFPGSDAIRQYFFGQEIHLCTIHNGKSGKCSEDCIFCAQSGHYSTQTTEYPLQDSYQLQEKGLWAATTPIQRYSIVTSGRGLKDKDVQRVAKAVEGLEDKDISCCVSLGILKDKELQQLVSAGVSRYHHNLESPRTFFSKVCTTHSFEQRVDTLNRAKSSGLSLCSGGVFGLGESDQEILEMALELREMDVDAVPLNFLVPVTGTPAADFDYLTPLRCLKIIAMFRYVLPEKEIIVCGGRQHNLGDLQTMMFLAGASGLMTGNYLTTQGVSLEDDLQLLSRLGLSPRMITK